ncbi:MAG: hypothetical protein EOO00_00425 [Chitinophagaceae bacterium]|nr:MAG: hypothetical protein EOO00_00425 [Chitinophagaceae bacterium]
MGERRRPSHNSATGLPAYCTRWGNEAKRMAVVNEVIAMAAEFEEQSAIAGLAASMQGFLVHLIAHKEVPASQSLDAVVLSTVHKAKGLEWPVVIAMNKPFDLSYCKTLFNTVHVSHPAGIGLDNLLYDQKILFFPWPFAKKRSLENISPDLDTAAAEIDTQLGARIRNQKEEDRLLYVALTRARDYLVLPVYKGKTFCELESDERGGVTGFLDQDQLITWLEDTKVKSVKKGPKSMEVMVEIRPAIDQTEIDLINATVQENEVPEFVEVYRDSKGSPASYALKYISPSLLNVDDSAALINPLAFKQEMIAVNNLSAEQYAALGICLHNIIASWRASQQSEVRLKKIAGLIYGFGMTGCLSAAELDQRCEVFTKFIQDTYNPKAIYHELPLTSICADSGQVVSGVADMVLQTEEGLVLIDHKSFPGHFESMAMNAESEFYAGRYAGQLDAYSKMLTESLGQPVGGRLVHYVVQGRVVEMA